MVRLRLQLRNTRLILVWHSRCVKIAPPGADAAALGQHHAFDGDGRPYGLAGGRYVASIWFSFAVPFRNLPHARHHSSAHSPGIAFLPQQLANSSINGLKIAFFLP